MRIPDWRAAEVHVQRDLPLDPAKKPVWSPLTTIGAKVDLQSLAFRDELIPECPKYPVAFQCVHVPLVACEPPRGIRRLPLADVPRGPPTRLPASSRARRGRWRLR